jgi:protein-L-isoaspartate O-methyltransferase
MATSSDCCKPAILQWIRAHVQAEARVLDVGAGFGTYARLLPEYSRIEAVEVWKAYVDRFELGRLYSVVHVTDALSFLATCDPYDLIILGDVLEHLAIADGQLLLERCRTKGKALIVSVPYLYRQDAIYDNPWEIHQQPDLTREVFQARYPGLELLCEEGGLSAWTWTRSTSPA